MQIEIKNYDNNTSKVLLGVKTIELTQISIKVIHIDKTINEVDIPNKGEYRITINKVLFEKKVFGGKK